MKKPVVYCQFVSLCFTCILSGLAIAEEDGASIIKKSDVATKSHSEFTKLEMQLIDGKGNVEQTRKLDIYFKKYPDKEVTLQKFLFPPIVQGAGLYIVDTGKSVNDIWMYLPTTRRLRRISGAEKSNYYMGTEFSYEDFEDYQIQNHNFKYIKDEECLNEKKCYLIESTPASETEKNTSSYSKKIYWIEKTSLYSVQVDFFNKQGEKIKSLVETNLEQFGKYWRPQTLLMKNLENNRSTRINVLDRQVDQAIDDYHLSKRFLRTD